MVIVALYVLFAFGIGFIVRTYVSSVADFLVSGRQLRVHLGIASPVGTELGLVTIMYFAEQGYRHGFSVFIGGIVWSAAYVVVGQTGFVIDHIRRLRVLTVTEFFERRYSRGVRVLAASLLLIAGLLNMGVFLKLGAVFLVHATNIPPSYLNLTMTVLVIVVLVYTVLGGMASVVITDYIQFLVLSIALLLATFLVFRENGFVGTFDRVAEHFGERGFDPFSNPDLGWWFIGYWAVLAVCGTFLWQPVAQRALAARSPAVN